MTLAKRVALLTPLFLTVSTGVVMAASTACRIVVLQRVQQAQATVHKRVHHSEETLARWKIGAEAWSKTHQGKVYAGRPMRRKQDWKPLTFTCEEVALDLTRPDGGLLTGESLPEFVAYASPVSPFELAEVTPPGAMAPVYGEGGFVGAPYLFPVGGGSGGGGIGGTPNGPVSPTSIPPGTPTGTRLAPSPQQPTQVTLLPSPTGVKFLPTPQQPTQITMLPEPPTDRRLQPYPQPPATVSLLPVPEPPGLILLMTGVAALGLSQARRWIRIA